MIKQEPDALVSGRLLPVIVSERNVEFDRSRPKREQLRHPDRNLSQTAKHRAGACGARPLDEPGSRTRTPCQMARIHLDPQRGGGGRLGPQQPQGLSLEAMIMQRLGVQFHDHEHPVR